MENIFLRRAKIEDVEILFDWVNETEVRRNSFRTEMIEYKDHLEWYKRSLLSPNIYIFILSNGVDNIGQVRIICSENSAEIDYSVDKKFRGKGYGKKIIELLIVYLNENNSDIKVLEAQVKKVNSKSNKVFICNGFRLTEESQDNYYIFRKILE